MDLVSVLIIALILFSDGFAIALVAFSVAIVADVFSLEKISPSKNASVVCNLDFLSNFS